MPEPVDITPAVELTGWPLPEPFTWERLFLTWRTDWLFVLGALVAVSVVTAALLAPRFLRESELAAGTVAVARGVLAVMSGEPDRAGSCPDLGLHPLRGAVVLQRPGLGQLRGLLGAQGEAEATDALDDGLPVRVGGHELGGELLDVVEGEQLLVGHPVVLLDVLELLDHAAQELLYFGQEWFELAQAATPWAPPTADQPGLIGPNWAKGWIIEDNVIHDAKCSAVSLGKEKSTGHNFATLRRDKPGYQYQLESVFSARQIGWDREQRDYSAGVRTFPLVAVAEGKNANGLAVVRTGSGRAPSATVRVIGPATRPI